MAELSLEQLREEFIMGNNQSFRKIFEDHGMYCIDNMKKRTGCSDDDARDVFMDSIIVFREKVISGDISYLTNIRNYLYTVCVNTIMESKRQKLRKIGKNDDVKDFLYDDLTNDPFMEDLQDIIEDHTLIQICFDTLEKLDPKCKCILTMFYVNELSIAEITEKLNFANKNVAKSSKSRCFKKWKEQILNLNLKGTSFE